MIMSNRSNLERDSARETADALLPVLRSDCQAWRAMEAEGWKEGGTHRLDLLTLGLVWKTVPVKNARHVTREAQSTPQPLPVNPRNTLAVSRPEKGTRRDQDTSVQPGVVRADLPFGAD